MDELMGFDIDSLRPSDREVVTESLINFTVALVLRNRPKLQSSINLAYSPIESICRESIKRLVTLFYMGDFKRAQTDIPLPTKTVEKFTLGQCNSSFEGWNRSRYSNIFMIPENIVSQLLKFINVRNCISHSKIPDLWVEDFDSMSNAVSEALVCGLSSVLWLMKNVVKKEEWMIPVEDALDLTKNILKTSEDTGGKLEQILEKTKETQELTQQTYDLLSVMFADFGEAKSSLLRRLREVEASQKGNAEQLFKRIIMSVEQGDTGKLNSVLGAIVNNRHEIIANCDRTPSSRGKITWLIELTKRTLHLLPAETAGNITAQVLLNASSKYLPILIGILASLL
jgi:hypothetical protein